MFEGDGEGDEGWLERGRAAPGVDADGEGGLEVGDVDLGVWC